MPWLPHCSMSHQEVKGTDMSSSPQTVFSGHVFITFAAGEVAEGDHGLTSTESAEKLLTKQSVE